MALLNLARPLISAAIRTWGAAAPSDSMQRDGFACRYNQTGKVQLHFVSDSNGFVSLQKADSLVEYVENVEVEKEVPDEDDASADATKNDTVGDGGSQEEEDSQKDKGDAGTGAKTDPEGSKDDGKDAKADGKDAKSEKPKPKMKKVKVMKRMKRTRVVALDVAETVYHGYEPMTEEEKKASRSKLSALRKKELAKQESARAKNELESYIISMSSSLEDNEELKEVTTEEQRSGFHSQLMEAEDWLYMDEAADEAEAKVYLEKLQELKKVGEPMEARVYELSRREERIAGAKKLIEIIGMATNSWAETKPWLNTTQVKALTDSADALSLWLGENIAEQAKKAPHEEPAFKVDEIAQRMEIIHDAFKRLQNVKPPKPPPPPPAPPSPPGTDTSAEQNDTEKAETAADSDQSGKAADAADGDDGSDDRDELRRR